MAGLPGDLPINGEMTLKLGPVTIRYKAGPPNTDERISDVPVDEDALLEAEQNRLIERLKEIGDRRKKLKDDKGATDL